MRDRPAGAERRPLPGRRYVACWRAARAVRAYLSHLLLRKTSAPPGRWPAFIALTAGGFAWWAPQRSEPPTHASGGALRAVSHRAAYGSYSCGPATSCLRLSQGCGGRTPWGAARGVAGGGIARGMKASDKLAPLGQETAARRLPLALVAREAGQALSPQPPCRPVARPPTPTRRW
jgi:hypothetical protein